MARHPETQVLSVDGQEHVDNNPYDNYFDSEGTFRSLENDDKRLAAKAPIFGHIKGDRPTAIAHLEFFGGDVFTHEVFGDMLRNNTIARDSVERRMRRRSVPL